MLTVPQNRVHIHCPGMDLDDPTNVPLEEHWFALPQLYITCYVKPRTRMSPTGHRTYRKDASDLAVQLMFYSTF